jgi:DNA processing protein
MNNISISDIIKLSFVPKFSYTKIKNLVNYFKDTSLIFEAKYNDLVKIDLINEKSAKIFTEFDFSSVKNEVDEQLKLIEKFNVNVVSFWDDSYPDKLKNIACSPILLFTRGDVSLLKSKSVAVIGTRTPTKYGKESAQYFATNLVKAGLTITSGLAYGIDTIAHQSAVTEKGKTISVFGAGVNIIYPKENSKLVDAILENGLIVSEYLMNTTPLAQHFPARNRIISGLSIGVLLIESGSQGGGMITAKFALDQSKSIFAVPGNINSSKSKGTNLLIKNSGAKLVQDIDDILDELNLSPILKTPTKKDLSKLSESEKKIMSIISMDPMHVDKISEDAGLNPSDTLVILLNLELESLIRKLPGNFYQIVE